LVGADLRANPQSPPGDYRTVESVLALEPDQIATASPVVLRGVVTQNWAHGLTMHDRSGGIWVYSDESSRFAPGSLIEVEGRVETGLYSPVVRAGSVRLLGTATLPVPLPVTLRQLNTGDEDSQYVSITGTLRSAGLRTGGSGVRTVWLKVEMADGPIDVQVHSADLAEIRPSIDALVKIDGTASSTKNQDRQLLTPVLIVAGFDAIKVLRPGPADLFDLPLVPIARLMQYRSRTDYFHRVRIAGTVTDYKPGSSLILQGATRAICVFTTEAGEIREGDWVEASGYPSPSDSGPVFGDAVVRIVRHGIPLQPVEVRLQDVAEGEHRNALVRVRGTVLRRIEEPTRVVLLLQSGDSLLPVELDEPRRPPSVHAIQEGSVVDVDGISVLDVRGTWNFGTASASVVKASLMLRSPDDIRVVQPPSWFTALHLIYLAAVMALLILILFIILLRSRIERWKLETVLTERERLANEVHDTLAQSFAGIGFQLQAIRRELPADVPHVLQQLDLARDLVRHSHKEARRSIEPRDRQTPQNLDLQSALEVYARKMVGLASIDLSIQSVGSARPLPPALSTVLCQIGHEAIANAIRHADPKHLQILLEFDTDSVSLQVSDDGCGFAVSGALLGFGLRSMRRRAAEVSARLEIRSAPAEGTVVKASAALPRSATLLARLGKLWGA